MKARGRRRARDLSHEEAMTRHALRAAWDRRGVVLSRTQYLDLCAACFIGDKPVETITPTGVPVFRVELGGGATVFAVWSVECQRIATFLPCREWVGQRWNGRGFVAEARAQQ